MKSTAPSGGFARRTLHRLASLCFPRVSSVRATAARGGRALRRLDLEALEHRQLLSAAGLVGVGQQPEGALSGKVVYVHAGHGWVYSSSNGWNLQRPETFEMVEDFGNIDQMNFLVDYLFRAGATVVPLRPAGHQVNEVILDNDDPEVTFSGTWEERSASIYYGDPGDVSYRRAQGSTTETAFARYRPDLPEDGFYPIYAWTRAGSQRVSDQLYRIAHTGGTTEVTVNHRRVGNGWVYLGNYYFEAGNTGYVDISNRSTDTGATDFVLADAIRFGNGMGDTNLGGGVSGEPREDEAGLYWIQSQFGQGTDTSGITGTVSSPPKWAAQMNREIDGNLTDRVFFSFHSNAGGGGARGTLALYNGNNNPSTATPNQFDYAQIVGSEVNDDMVALNGQFEHNWLDRSVVTLDRSDIEFGEINNTHINDEFDATILEVAFHDNEQDAELMRDPKVRDAVARASYQAIVRYFNQFDGATPVDLLPDPVTNPQAIADGNGNITVSWAPPVVDGIGGDAPTGYRVYTSLDGLGFDGGTFVAGGATTSHAFTNLDAANGVHYFRVVAVNNGGESAPSAVVASQPLDTGPSSVLIVNGFDRLGRSQNFRQPFGSNGVDRVRQRYANTQDYSVQVAEAVESFSTTLGVDTVQNEAVTGGVVMLDNYDTVVWILGEESSVDFTFDAAEQALVAAYLSNGGNLFTSGAEIGWDLDSLNNGRSFYNNTLRADYVSDDAQTYSAQGAAGSVFEGMTVAFDDGTGNFYDTEFPDVISPLGGATTAMNYVGGAGGGAAIQYQGSGGEGSVVMLGFPFETIVDENDRTQVMAAVLNFFGTAPSEAPAAPTGLLAFPLDGSVVLNWDDNAEDDLSGYNVYRSPAYAGPYVKVNGALAGTSYFVDHTVANDLSYFYVVTAVDTDSNEGTFSAIAMATPSAIDGLKLFSDRFDTDTSSNYAIVSTSSDAAAAFAFDYSALSIPSAPNTMDGTTQGLKLEANLDAPGTTEGITLHTLSQFSGDYVVTFDMWINANGPFPEGGSGSTEFLTAGVGGDGATVNFNTGGDSGTGSGGWTAVSGEGGSIRDYRAVKDASEQFAESGQFAAGTSSADGGAHNHLDAYYAGFGNVNVGALGQGGAQTGATKQGTVGMQWHAVEILVDADGGTGAAASARWSIDGLEIATLDAGNGGFFDAEGTVALGYMDIFTSLSDNPAFSFGLIDNLMVRDPQGRIGPGDMDFDGDTDFDDIDDFVLGLSDPNQYLATYGVASTVQGDIDGDGDHDFDDIDDMVALLSGGLGANAATVNNNSWASSTAIDPRDMSLPPGPVDADNVADRSHFPGADFPRRGLERMSVPVPQRLEASTAFGSRGTLNTETALQAIHRRSTGHAERNTDSVWAAPADWLARPGDGWQGSGVDKSHF